MLVDQPAEDLATSDSRCRQVGGHGHGDVVAVWWPQVPGPVRAMAVVVRGFSSAEMVQDLAGASCRVADDLPAQYDSTVQGISLEGIAFGFVGCATLGGVVVLPSVAEDGDFPLRPGEVDDGDGAGAACGCRISCHSMRPGHIRGSGRRAGPVAGPGHSDS